VQVPELVAYHVAVYGHGSPVGILAMHGPSRRRVEPALREHVQRGYARVIP
jgi:hypothetical protein